MDEECGSFQQGIGSSSYQPARSLESGGDSEARTAAGEYVHTLCVVYLPFTPLL
jgi:hypothetical protein